MLSLTRLIVPTAALLPGAALLLACTGTSYLMGESTVLATLIVIVLTGLVPPALFTAALVVIAVALQRPWRHWGYSVAAFVIGVVCSVRLLDIALAALPDASLLAFSVCWSVPLSLVWVQQSASRRAFARTPIGATPTASSTRRYPGNAQHLRRQRGWLDDQQFATGTAPLADLHTQSLPA